MEQCITDQRGIREEHGESTRALAIEGMVIVRDYERDIANQVVYKQRCDTCGYIIPQPPIVVSCMPGGTVYVWLLPCGELHLPLLRQLLES
jgi:hypothetical protein